MHARKERNGAGGRVVPFSAPYDPANGNGYSGAHQKYLKEVSRCRIHQGIRGILLLCNQFRGCANPFQTCEKDRREREEEARQEEHRKLLAERNQRALDRALAPAFVKVG